MATTFELGTHPYDAPDEVRPGKRNIITDKWRAKFVAEAQAAGNVNLTARAVEIDVPMPDGTRKVLRWPNEEERKELIRNIEKAKKEKSGESFSVVSTEHNGNVYTKSEFEREFGDWEARQGGSVWHLHVMNAILVPREGSPDVATGYELASEEQIQAVMDFFDGRVSESEPESPPEPSPKRSKRSRSLTA